MPSCDVMGCNENALCATPINITKDFNILVRMCEKHLEEYRSK